MKTNNASGNDQPINGSIALIALGSNQLSVAGGPKDTVLQAMEIIENSGVELLARSRLYTTYAYPIGSGPDFINAAIKISISQSAEQILSLLHRIEAQFGRERLARWGPRTVDLDLLAVAAEIRPDIGTYQHWRMLPVNEQAHQAPVELILPHPRLQDRAFVLVPLADVAPEWVHPVLKKSVRKMLNALPAEDKKGVRLVE